MVTGEVSWLMELKRESSVSNKGREGGRGRSGVDLYFEQKQLPAQFGDDGVPGLHRNTYGTKIISFICTAAEAS